MGGILGYLWVMVLGFGFGALWNHWYSARSLFPETPTQRCNRSKGLGRQFIWKRRYDFRSSPRWGRERWRSVT